MLRRPLSERLEQITGRLIGEKRKKPKAKAAENESPTTQAKPKQVTTSEGWDATQVCCPIPPRNPDGWIL
jgi:hypothetical protein